ncbi:MAG: hypothetical protein WC758_08430 [Candidatus Woesearchaeota archaeon]|jgi:hypothetical protein
MLKKHKMNKKGFVFGMPFVLTVIVAIIAFVAFASGGIGAVWNTGQLLFKLTSFLSKIPAVAWMVIGFFFLFLMIRGRR